MPSNSEHEGAVRLYRFYNWEVSNYGEPFALCDAHREMQPVPHNCSLAKIADNATRGCQWDSPKEQA